MTVPTQRRLAPPAPALTPQAGPEDRKIRVIGLITRRIAQARRRLGIEDSLADPPLAPQSLAYDQHRPIQAEIPMPDRCPIRPTDPFPREMPFASEATLAIPRLGGRAGTDGELAAGVVRDDEHALGFSALHGAAPRRRWISGGSARALDTSRNARRRPRRAPSEADGEPFLTVRRETEGIVHGVDASKLLDQRLRTEGGSGHLLVPRR